MIDWNAIIKETYPVTIEDEWKQPMMGIVQRCNIDRKLFEVRWMYRHDLKVERFYCNTVDCQKSICNKRCENYQPEGIPMKLADLCLYICNWMGENKCRYNHMIDKNSLDNMNITFPNFINAIYNLIEDEEVYTSTILDVVEICCERLNIPLEEALHKKMEYSKKSSIDTGMGRYEN